MHPLSFLFLLLVYAKGCGKAPFQPEVTVHSYPLGTDTLEVTVSRYDTARFPVLVHLHDNEQTARETAHQLLQQTGGLFISLRNKGERLVAYTRKRQKFTFDPNRIFTPAGIAATLVLYGSYDSTAAEEVAQFARFFLQKIPATSALVALHNNTDDNYSIKSYQADSAATDAAAVYVNPAMDADDFIFTTDSLLFTAFREKNLNVVLQNNQQVTDDGSLSVYWAGQGKAYVNIETEHGHLQEQLALLKQVLRVIQAPTPQPE